MSLHWVVNAQLIGEEGQVIWGYSRSEGLVAAPNDEAAKTAVLRTGGKMLDAIDEAKESIGEQIRAMEVS